MPGENNVLPAVVFGSGLVLLGVWLMRRHLIAWGRQQSHDMNDAEQQHYATQFRRRMQTSGMVALVGILIAFGDILIWRFGPLAASLFWIAVLLLVAWIGLLALGDIFAIQTHSRTESTRHQAGRRALEQELAEHRRRSQTPPMP